VLAAYQNYLYLEQCKKDETEVVSEWVYRRIFNCEFNLSFHCPSTDTRKKCDVYAVQRDAPGTDCELLQQEWNAHLALADLKRSKAKCIESKS